ncbi:hypothetical protein BDDG_03305 [Blastomyces dermatitidis ATCC 18188]|nr:hypothetical protein BDDG_03305 [Blastomyces dermatitidis ATCC 18188]
MKALFDPVEWRDWKLNFAKEQIERFTVAQRPDMVESLKERYLPYVFSTVLLQDLRLQPIAYYRLETLKELYDADWTTLYRTNIKAVMEAYRNGTLKVVSGAVSYWYNGHMKIAPTREPVNLEEELPKWRAEHGPEGIGANRSLLRFPNLLLCLLIRAILRESPMTHAYTNNPICLALPWSGLIHTILVLDDTGSAYLELFNEDCSSLGFDPFMIPSDIVRGSVDLVTACVEIEAQFLATDLN